MNIQYITEKNKVGIKIKAQKKVRNKILLCSMLISKILQIKFHKTIINQLLHKNLIYFIFVAAKITIAKSWKTKTIPFYILKAKLSWIMVNGCLSAILHDKISLFEKSWNPWIEYLNDSSRNIPN